MATHSDPSTTPTVGVVTVSYGSEEVLVGFLASIREASANTIPVAVADNLPSSGGTEALCADAGATYVPMIGT